MRENRISVIIGNISQKYVNEAAAYSGGVEETHFTRWIKWAGVAACVVLVAAFGISVSKGRLFGTKEDIAVLDNGNTINFIESDSAMKQSDIALQLETRALEESEVGKLFHGLPVTAYALFNAEDSNIIGIEGNIDDMKLIVSKSDMMLNDVVIEGEEKASDVDGVSVYAGYFITKADSRGGKTVIYYASFKLGGCTVYLEHAGPDDESETVRDEIASVIKKVISFGEINLEEIKK